MRSITVITMLLLAVTCEALQQTEVPEAVAQDVKALREMVREDHAAIDALVMVQEEELRNAIFEVSAHPELLARLARVQGTASNSFRRIVSCLTPPEQKMAWDIARYPGLAGDLVDSSGNFQQILLDYPTAVHSAAMALATRRENCDVLTNIYQLQAGVDDAYQALVTDYSEATRKAMDQLLPRPEILSLLTENMDQSVLIGSIYRKDPSFVRKRASELGKIASEKNSKAEADWRSLLAASPMALGELTQAGASFAADRRRDFASRETGALTPPAFSFWFGTPPGQSWYSYPDYFAWGFYYDVDGSVLLASLPSAEFVEWIDPNQFPQLADAILKYYRAHPDMTGGFYSAVRQRIQSMKEAKPVPVSEIARQLAEGLKLSSPTDMKSRYQATDYWMSTNYLAIKEAGGIGGIPKQ